MCSIPGRPRESGFDFRKAEATLRILRRRGFHREKWRLTQLLEGLGTRVREAVTEDLSVQRYWQLSRALSEAFLMASASTKANAFPKATSNFVNAESTNAHSKLGRTYNSCNHSRVLCAQVCLKLPVGSNGLPSCLPSRPHPWASHWQTQV